MDTQVMTVAGQVAEQATGGGSSAQVVALMGVIAFLLVKEVVVPLVRRLTETGRQAEAETDRAMAKMEGRVEALEKWLSKHEVVNATSITALETQWKQMWEALNEIKVDIKKLVDRRD